MLCPSPSWGGLEMNVERISRWLLRRGHRIVFIGDPDSILFARMSALSSVVSVPFRSSSKGSDLLLAPQLARIIRKHDIRNMVSHLNRNFLLTALAIKLAGRNRKLVYVQHMHVGGTKRDLLHTSMYRQLDAWVTPLDIFVKPLLEKTHLKMGQISVIPFGIELDRFTKNRPIKSEARKRLSLPQDATIAGVVGRLDPKKCQHILIEACTTVHTDGSRLHLLIVGDESKNETGYAERLRHLVAEFQLESYVHFRPHFDEVQYAYAAMDIFALTSQSETYGMVTIEAMASGLAVIGTNEGGTPGIISDGVNGLLVPPLDAAKLSAALRKLIDDEDFRSRLSRAAESEAMQKYAHTRQCELYEQLFARLAGES